MRLLLTFVFFISLCVVQSVCSELSRLSKPDRLHKLLNKGTKPNHIRGSLKTKCCKGDSRYSSELLKKLSNYNKRTCKWCPYAYKIEPGSESDQHKEGKMEYWQNPNSQRKSRRKR